MRTEPLRPVIRPQVRLDKCEREENEAEMQEGPGLHFLEPVS